MSTRTWLIGGLLVAVVAGIGTAALLVPRAPLVLRSGTALDEPIAIGDFELVDQQGRAFGRSAFEDRWSLIFTGFTNCPDLCPATLTLLAQLRNRLPGGSVQLLFVSVDPERDTPARLAEYLAHFGPDLAGATGSREQVEDFTARLGLAQVRNPGVGGEYSVDHSTALVLIDPQVRIAGYFRPPHDVAALAADLAALAGGAG